MRMNILRECLINCSKFFKSGAAATAFKVPCWDFSHLQLSLMFPASALGIEARRAGRAAGILLSAL